MGMSASQVRFLSLQHRKHDVGRQLTTLSNRKLSLSRDMNRIAKNYTNAMNQNVLRWSNDSGITYHDLTYDTMMSPNELNAAKPYIVTDGATGRVVLNNDKLLGLDGKPLKGNVSYVDIAKMISTYSGMDSENKPVYYPESKCIHVGTDGVTMGDKAIDGAYVIPDTTREFTFDNSLRFEIFKKMGLISDRDVIEQTSLLTKLYGGVEAQKDGVYPIGSAWGNYYIALANLDAYEDFLNHEQSFATANTYINVTYTAGDKNSDNLSVQFKDSSALYDYEAEVNASGFFGESLDAAISTISQTVRPEGNQSVKHVDFSKVITMQVDGTWSAVDSNPADVQDYLYDESGLDHNYKQFIAKLNDTNDGIVYKYVINNVLYDALANYQGSSIYIDALTATDAKAHSVEVSYHERDKSYVSEGHKNEARTALEVALGDFVGLMSAATLADYPAEALNAAAAKTRQLYENAINDEYVTEWGDYEDVSDCARDNSSGFIGFGAAHKPSIWFGIGHGNGCCVAISLDCRTLFNTFMSYVNYYMVNEREAGLDDISVSHATYVDNGSLEHHISNVTYDSTARNGHVANEKLFVGSGTTDMPGSTGQYLVRQIYTADTSATGVQNRPNLFINGSGAYLEKDGHSLRRYVPDTYKVTAADGTVTTETYTDSSDPTGNNIKWKLGSGDLDSYYAIYVANGTSYTLKDAAHTNPNGYLEYKQTAEEEAYGWNGSTPWKAEGSNTEVTGVYGVVKTNTGDGFKTYLIKSASEWAAYVSQYASGKPLSEICPGAVPYVDTSDAPVGFGQVLYQEREAYTRINSKNGYTVILDQDANKSRFDIRTYALPYDNEEFHQKLRDAVQEAQAYIDELETELADFYGAKESKLMDFYDALFKDIAKNGWMIDDRTSRSRGTVADDYLNGRFQNNDYFVTVVEQSADSRDYDYLTRQAVNVTKIFQVHDEDTENVALSEYEAEKALISSKERVIDARMRKLETEQEVINTELDSIKQIIKDNVDKTFKIFA